MKAIATICARGGSVGVPRKNIRPLLGKPLIAFTIEQARACQRIDRVFVSTDDAEIADIALSFGAEVPFLRPAELATSDASKLDAIRHLVNWVVGNQGPVETIVDLDPTSPLRTVDDITECINLLTNDVDMVITGYLAEKNPYFNMVEYKADASVGLVIASGAYVKTRQSAKHVYAMNASVYVWHAHRFSTDLWSHRSIKLHVMPRERSIDIDSEIDFDLVELYMRRRLAAGAPSPL